MYRAMIMNHLAEAERHVIAGAHRLEQQRALIERLQRRGDDISVAEALLHRFEDVQKMQIADRDRLQAELSAPDR